MVDRYRSVEICRIRKLLGNLASPAPACPFFFPGLGFFGVFICEADLLVEIRLDEPESFPSGLEKDVVKFCDCRARAQRLEQLPGSDQYHIDHRMEYFSVYCEEAYDNGKGVVLDAAEILCCLLPEGCPRLFRIRSNSKVCCLNLEPDPVTSVLQVVAALPVEIEDIVQRDGDLFPASLFAFAQPNC